MTGETAIGEIIESGTMSFVAQCLEIPRENVPKLYDPPAFGSFVKVNLRPSAISIEEFVTSMEEPDPFADLSLPLAATNALPLSSAIYAIVCGSMTTSLDSSRRPSALGFPDEEQMRLQQPQIFELLRTEFTGLLIAYSEGEGKGLRRHLPPKPPRIHALVTECSPQEVRAITDDLSFLRGLLAPTAALAGTPSDELAAACLRQAREAHPNDQTFLLRAGKTLAVLLAGDYERLQAILRNVL